MTDAGWLQGPFTVMKLFTIRATHHAGVERPLGVCMHPTPSDPSAAVTASLHIWYIC